MANGTPGLQPGVARQVGAELQTLLVDSLAPALNGKQAHWHVTGRYFAPLHEQLDAIVDDTREWADLAPAAATTVATQVSTDADTVVTVVVTSIAGRPSCCYLRPS